MCGNIISESRSCREMRQCVGYIVGFSFSLNPSTNTQNEPPQPTTPDSPPPEATLDPVKLAFEKPKAYKKKSIQSATEEDKSKMLSVEKEVGKKEKLRISNIDFICLIFADKKTGRGVPAGLVPVQSDPFPEGDSPEVEIIVRLLGTPASLKFEEATVSKPLHTQQEDKSDFYRPKVSTWGVFPKLENISKTFGDERTIRPGDVIETAEDRAAKEEHTK
ncbi:hypothetical protein Ddye_031629 [Dipteronia dyeriana]|uniref:Uncharacterized protein n=1 Tax=Dipteronia dyeriana TaxID=168575 RepID=A0AAD9TJB5_9ROSI|nr:hypothetical protein Ddye_031629 [Dipteronia dyeriana]